ncbi:glycosyltransferase [Sulfolobus tengchongensis]|uniref:Glycosyltransferase n=1 Tax=Sulfolobus tengchongensis TaxID=207809 RepID=A0AAX4KXW9_9CREN
MILIIGELPITSGGGGIRNVEILRRFDFEFEFIPSTYNIYNALRDHSYKEKLLEKINQLKLNVSPCILKLLETRKTLSKLQIIKQISNFMKNKTFEIIYSQADILEDIILASKINGRHRGFLIQGVWFSENFWEDLKLDFMGNRDVMYDILSIGFLSLKRAIYRNLFVHYVKYMDFVNTINPKNQEYMTLEKKNIRKNIIFPGNAIRELNKLDQNMKEDYFIYPARYNPSKGFLLLPYIWKEVTRRGYNIKLYVSTNDFNNPYVKRFIRLSKKFKLENIVYVGFLDTFNFSLYVSKAKGVIVPSLRETYSLTTLESLYLGTVYLGFRTPTLEYLYGSLKPVFLGSSIEEIADNVIKVNNLTNSEYKELFDEKTKKFIELHSSWDRVAKMEQDTLLYLTKK